MGKIKPDCVTGQNEVDSGFLLNKKEELFSALANI